MIDPDSFKTQGRHNTRRSSPVIETSWLLKINTAGHRSQHPAFFAGH